MASQQDLQNLLVLLTTGRNKMPMLAAMGRVKALQAANLRSIPAIAASDLPTLTTAISDEKAAKSLLAACKAHIKSPGAGSKRTATETLSSTSKRPKSAFELASEPQTPTELEASLILPQPSADEEAISKCTIYTNRAPLVLAFAMQLLKYTMPDQPPSSRLSLAQAVVSLNSRSKAVSLGIEKGKGAEEEGWGTGQPKVVVMGREVAVLKRSGYEWKEEITKPQNEPVVKEDPYSIKEEGHINSRPVPATVRKSAAKEGWTVSTPITSKSSTFIARSISISTSSQASAELEKLLSANSDLCNASHTITAYRVLSSSSNNIVESSNDDGESGGGRHLLSLLQADNLTDILLVVSRWYGGIMLGPDRWRIMTQVSRDALSQRLRVAGTIGGEALWGLDLEGMKNANSSVIGGGMPVHRPEGARAYLLKSFGSPTAPLEGGEKKKKKSAADLGREKEENLGLLLGALDLLFASWVDHIGKAELDRKAWSWYVQVRPNVESGVAGWGGKGDVNLVDILKLRRKG